MRLKSGKFKKGFRNKASLNFQVINKHYTNQIHSRIRNIGVHLAKMKKKHVHISMVHI